MPSDQELYDLFKQVRDELMAVRSALNLNVLELRKFREVMEKRG